MGSVGKTFSKVFGGGASDIGSSMVNVAKAEVGGVSSDTDTDTDTPSYFLDTEAAARRKRALALKRGFMSTRRATGSSSYAGTLSADLTGKTKLGQ